MSACSAHKYNTFTIAKCNAVIQFLTQVISLADAILMFPCLSHRSQFNELLDFIHSKHRLVMLVIFLCCSVPIWVGDLYIVIPSLFIRLSIFLTTVRVGNSFITI